MADTLTTHDAPAHGRFALIRGLAEGWWLFLLRGVAAIAFGVVAMANPLLGLIGLLGFLGAWMLVDGLFTLWQAITGPSERHGVWFWLDGILSLLAAAAIFVMPGLSSVALVIVAGAWWAATGVFEIVAAVRRESWLLGLAGLASLVLGGLVLAFPGPGLLMLVWFAAIQAVVFGVLLITLGVRLRRVAKDSNANERRLEEAQATGAHVPAAPGAPPTEISPAVAPGAVTGAIAPTAVPAVDTGEPNPPANDPGRRGRGAA